jgi:uncharacterized repeat protein (TIGR04076 family)
MSHPICAKMVAEKEQPPKATYEANDHNCRYHPGNIENEEISLLSQGMCPITFLHIYPTLFALHLNQNKSKIKINSNDLNIYCPLGTDGVLFKTYTTKIKISFIDYVKQFFTKKNPWLRKAVNLVYPIELFGKNTHLEAVSEGQGCPFGIKKGDTFTFNLDKKDEFCPAAFNSVYPLLGTGKDNFSVGCPDYQTNVRFSLENSPATTLEDQTNCDSYSSKIKIIRTIGDFECPIDLNRWYSIDEIINASGIRCFSSFHVAFPYFYALYNGGQLGFLTGERYTAGIGCPNATYLVKYKVSRDEKGRYKYSCEKSHQDCPRKIGLDEDIIIDNFENGLPFYYGLSDLYTALTKIESLENDQNEPVEVAISSMRGKTGMVWSILRST